MGDHLGILRAITFCRYLLRESIASDRGICGFLDIARERIMMLGSMLYVSNSVFDFKKDGAIDRDVKIRAKTLLSKTATRSFRHLSEKCTNALR